MLFRRIKIQAKGIEIAVQMRRRRLHCLSPAGILIHRSREKGKRKKKRTLNAVVSKEEEWGEEAEKRGDQSNPAISTSSGAEVVLSAAEHDASVEPTN